MSEEAMTLEEAQRRYDEASAELDRICQHPRANFRMRIPAQRDDSDLILSGALLALRELIEAAKSDPAQELRDAVRLADTYFDKYIEEDGWNDELEEKWPEDLLNDQETIRRLVGMEDA